MTDAEIKRKDLDVHLMHVTPNAERILSFAKDTRLLGSADDNSHPFLMMMNRDVKDVMENVKYSMNTIRGPLEFIHYIFLITNASRAMTHQLVRHRVVSFAQQSLRVSDAVGYYLPPDIEKNEHAVAKYEAWMVDSKNMYQALVDLGIPMQDSRGVLPLHVTSAILMKINLRALLEMFEVRLCLRVQGEHRKAMMKMANLTGEIHSWTKDHIGPLCSVKGICAFPRYNCPVSNAFPELKGLPDNKKISVKDFVDSFGSKGLQPRTQK